MVASNVFALELPVFYLYLLLGLLALLFAEDTLPLVPVFLCSYMTISPENNPATHVGESAFYDKAFQVQFIVILVVAVLAIAARLVHSLVFSPTRAERRGCPRAHPSGFWRSASLTSSAGCSAPSIRQRRRSSAWWRSPPSARSTISSITPSISAARKRTIFCAFFLLLGFGIMLETVRLYFLPGVVTPDGVDRGKLTTGWGMYNNIGCIIAMCIPASFYFASTRKNGWQYTLLGCLTLAGVVLTQSRGSILFGGIVFLASYAYVIVKSRGRERLYHLIVAGALILLAMIAVAVFFEKFMQLFSSMLRFDSNGRDGIWESGLKQFAGHPLFGVGFYECEAFRWGQLPSIPSCPRAITTPICS